MPWFGFSAAPWHLMFFYIGVIARGSVGEFLQKEMKTEEVYGFIADSIDQIFQGEDVYDNSTTSKKEFREFVDSLTTKQFEQIQQFYATAPKLSHTFSVVNPKTGVKSDYTLEGLQSFFA